MIKIDKNNITLTKGDTLIAEIGMTRSDGKIYLPCNTDRIRFALKKTYDDVEPLIVTEVPVDTLILRVESEETKKLETNLIYVYDIELTTANGVVNTFISGKLKVVNEVH